MFVNVLVGTRRSGIGLGLALLLVVACSGATNSNGRQESTPPSESAPSSESTRSSESTPPLESTPSLESAPSSLSAPEGMPGENVSERSTVTAFDAATGHQVWQASPPMAFATPIAEDDGTLILRGSVSPATCVFSPALTKLDSASGAFISAEILDPPQTLEEGAPPITDGALTIRYVLRQLPDGPSTGLEADDSTTGSMVWTNTQPGDDGPGLLDPPLFGAGVIVAAVGGRNPTNLGPASAIEFIDEPTGAILWTSPGDPAVAIGGGIAYVLNAGELEAHDIRTGTSRWRQETDATQVTANDHLAVVSGAAGTVAYDTSGNRLWKGPLGVDRDGLPRGGLLVGDDNVFVVTASGRNATQCSE